VGVKISDLKIDEFADLRIVKDGELCERCGAPLKVKNALEVGHIFQLGTKYSESLDVKYADADGTLEPIVMGSYGIGVGRVMAAAVELYHDEKGIIWPFSIAPYHINIVEINPQKTAETTEKIYTELKESKFETLWDDRNISAGVKFKDAELIGIPINIVVSENNLSRGEVEIQVRKDGSKFNTKLEVLRETLESVVKDKEL